MNILVNTSTRFSRTPDGRFWAPAESQAYEYWRRFLDVFDEVTVLGRAFPAEEPVKGAKTATGYGVSVIPLPNYCGIRQFARNYFKLSKVVQASVPRAETVYLSLPCLIGDLVWRSLPRDRPFGVGVCGDPHDVFAPGASNHPLRPVMRWWFSRELRIECQKACACTYVTKHALQNRYPCGDQAFSTYYSSIHLPPEALVWAARVPAKRAGPFHIVNVGTFDSWYKGPDILLQAFGACVRRGRDLSLTLIGDGRYRRDAERIAEMLAVGRRVRFLGQLPCSEAVREELDAADLFVLPSRTEGLPKAMIEAMARGLPCIGTTVGGIPELLPKEDLVPPNDPEALSRLIEDVLADPERRAAMSVRNLGSAQEYRSHILQQRRITFYQALQSRTAAWLKTRPVLSIVTRHCA